jgi:hypothetical protein
MYQNCPNVVHNFFIQILPEKIYPFFKELGKYCGQVVNAPALYSGGSGFMFLAFVVFLGPLR